MAYKAYQTRFSDVASPTSDIIQQLIKEHKPKANALERIFALPSAIGNFIDPLYAAKYEGKGLGGGIKEYLGNVGQGIETTLTGEKSKNAMKTTSDLLEKWGVLQGKDWGSKIARTAVSFAGDVLTDPTTYISFGTSGIGKATAKKAIEELGSDALRKIATKGIHESLIERLSKEGLEAGVKHLAEQGLEKESYRLAKMGVNLAKQKTVKFTVPFMSKLGTKEFVPTSKLGQLGLNAARLATEPIPLMVGGAWGQAKKYLPQITEPLTETALNIFNKAGLAKKQGLTPLYDILKETGSKIKNVSRKSETILGELQKPITEWYSKLDDKSKLIAGDIIEGKAVNPLKQYDTYINKYREVINPLSNELKKRGILPIEQIVSQLKTKVLPSGLGEKAAQTIDNLPSETSYLSRSVRGFDKDFLEMKHGAEGLQDILANPTAQRELKDTGELSLKTYNDIVSKNPVLMSKSSLTGAASKYLGDERVYKSMDEGVKQGVKYNNDIFQNMVDSVNKAGKTLAQDDLLKALPNIKDSYGVNRIMDEATAKAKFGDKIPTGFQEVSLGGKKFFATDKETKNILQSAGQFLNDEGAKNALKGYDTALGWWKKSVTGMGPGFIGYNVRNAIGDFTNMLFDGFSLKNANSSFKKSYNVLAFESLAKKEGIEAATKKFGEETASQWTKLVDNGILGSDMGKIADEVGILNKVNISDKYKNALKTPVEKTKMVWDKTKKGYVKIVTVGGLAPKREELFRVAHYFNTLDRTGSTDEAVKAVKRALFDFGDLTGTEREVFKRVVPFYSFLKKNFEFHLTNYMQKPGKYMIFQKGLDNIRKLGADMTPEEYDSLPDWIKGGIAITTGKQGSLVKMITGLGLPTESINSILGGEKGILKGGLSNLLSSMSPMLKVPLETATGKSFFTDKPIIEGNYGGDYENMPDMIKKLLGYRERQVKGSKGMYTQKTVDPYMAYAMQNIPGLAPLLTQIKRGYKAKADSQALLQLLSGIKYTTRNLEQEKKSREQEAKVELEKLLLRKGLGSSYTGFNLYPDAKKELINKQ